MSTIEFNKLIISHQSFLNQLAMKLTKSVDDAEDLIQDTMFKAIKNKDKYQEGTNLKGWLYTIMKNTFTIIILCIQYLLPLVVLPLVHSQVRFNMVSQNDSC